MTFQCPVCGKAHEGLPDFALTWPDYYFGVPEAERGKRIRGNSDTCVIDDELETIGKRFLKEDTLMDMATLEKRITRLEDIEAIKQLKARYCEICDDLHNPDTIASVFAEDAIWESPDFGKAQGHAEIRALFSKFRKMFSFSQHNIMNPQIKVNGDRATGIWYIMGPWTYAENNDEKWLALRYDDDYVKVGGEWKYHHLRVVLRMVADRQGAAAAP